VSFRCSPQVEDESLRLKSLQALHVLDTAPSVRFDALTGFATRLFEVPMAVVTLIDRDRQWFKSRQGVDLSETPRDVAFCNHTIQTDGIFVVEDARSDPRFAANPLVVHAPRIRFYAGCPLRAADGRRVGSLAVIDTRPRSLSARELEWLTDLGRMAELELHSGQVEHERNIAEQQLRLNQQHLEQQETALLEAVRRKDEFLATMAHELRNPLAPIRTAAELIKRRQPADPMVVQAQAIIERQSDHLARLVDDLLDIARITHGQVLLVRKPESVASIMADAVDAVRPALEAAGHTLLTRLPLDGLRVQVDAVRATQALTNLLNNAVKYTPDGGRIELSAHADGPLVHLTVRDNGLGIAAEDTERIFGLFSQDKRSLHRRQGGLGIGLGLARQLARMHGGSLSCSSPGPDQGSTFVLSLPQAADEEPGDAAGATAAADGSAATVPLSVLLVDDNSDALATLQTLLLMDGHAVTVAPDGRQALALATASVHHVVLLDLGLPDMDGCEVARQIRAASRASPGPVLVAVTGWGQSDDRRRTAEAGFHHHLTKPVRAQELQRLLRQIGTAAA